MYYENSLEVLSDFLAKFYTPAIVTLLAGVVEQLALNPKENIKLLPKSDLFEFFEKDGANEGLVFPTV